MRNTDWIRVFLSTQIKDPPFFSEAVSYDFNRTATEDPWLTWSEATTLFIPPIVFKMRCLPLRDFWNSLKFHVFLQVVRKRKTVLSDWQTSNDKIFAGMEMPPFEQSSACLNGLIGREKVEHKIFRACQTALPLWRGLGRTIHQTLQSLQQSVWPQCAMMYHRVRWWWWWWWCLCLTWYMIYAWCLVILDDTLY